MGRVRKEVQMNQRETVSEKTILGIDLGTSSVKVMLLNPQSGVLGTAAREYGVDIPLLGYAEQRPETWWAMTVEALQELRAQLPQAYAAVCAIGLSAQMHGLITVDANGDPVRPAMIWLDQRSQQELAEISQQMTFTEMKEIFHNRVFTGFLFPSLLWVKKHEPEKYDRIASVMLPKDFIRLKLTGCVGTDASDASASCLGATSRRDWAWEIIDRFGLRREIFPPVHEATEIAGHTTAVCAAQTGLKEGIPVVFGSADQPAQGIGNGQITEGTVICNIGTGGQISAYSAEAKYDPQLRIHTFGHAINRGYTIFGATLCAGMSLKWLRTKILENPSYDAINEMAAQIAPGSDGLLYLPYLSGERTPLMNPSASGLFWGLRLGHDKRHMIRAVMEGITFSLKDSMQIFEENNIPITGVIASGGGSNSPLWLQMQADIFGRPVRRSLVREQACLGACIVAGVGTGTFSSIQEACGRFSQLDTRVYEPNPETVEIYRRAYANYRAVVETNVPLMKEN